jgi:hypothetical protein
VAETGTAVIGISNVSGVVGVSESGVAVEGRTTTGKAIVGTANGLGGRAGYFSGDVEVIGDILLPVPTEDIQMATVSLSQKLADIEKKLEEITEKLVEIRKTQNGMARQQFTPNGFSASSLIEQMFYKIVDP